MANKGSTKLTYSELATENSRVRGLLQRQYDLVRDEILVRNTVHDRNFATYTKQAFRLTATLRETELALAESADIGKLDTANKSGDEILKDLMQELGYVLDMGGKLTPSVQSQMKKASEYLNSLVPRLAGSAETGGEKAAPLVQLPRCENWSYVWRCTKTSGHEGECTYGVK